MQATETEQLSSLITRFRELRSRHSHMPLHGRTPETRRQFQLAQTEMFNIAQAICGLAQPRLQRALDDVRREIMEQITLGIKAPTGARVVAKQLRFTSVIWSEFQITPEVAQDPSINDNAVLLPLLRRLKPLLRAQCGLINGCTIR